MSHSGFSTQADDMRGADDSLRYLVVEASPIRWSLEATKVLRIMPLEAWNGQVVDLDAVLTAQPDQPIAGNVIVLQSTGGAFAVATRHPVHLESCSARDLLPIPRLIFGDHYESKAARQLLLRENAIPVVALDIDTLCRMVHAISEETRPQPKAGEPT